MAREKKFSKLKIERCLETVRREKQGVEYAFVKLKSILTIKWKNVWNIPTQKKSVAHKQTNFYFSAFEGTGGMVVAWKSLGLLQSFVCCRLLTPFACFLQQPPKCNRSEKTCRCMCVCTGKIIRVLINNRGRAWYWVKALGTKVFATVI